MDHTDPRQMFDEVIITPDPFEFVRRAYRLVLRREASDTEVRRRGWLLKYLPFYTRDRFLRRLLQSPEAGLIGRATVIAGETLLQQGVARDREVQEGMAAVEERVKVFEAVETRVKVLETRLAEAVGSISAQVTGITANAGRADEQLGQIGERLDRLEAILNRWPTPEPFPVSLICERLDRLEVAAVHMRVWTEKAQAELREVTGPILADQRAEWKRVGDLRSFERKVFSQQGEDGILEEIFRRIGETNRHFVEFGVETGVECNAARLARECGWSGLFMEGNPDDIPALKANYAHLPGVRCVQAMVSSANVQQLFADAKVPAEPDLLVIDIDGNDYWVWKAITDYRPRVVVVEYNPFYPPPVRWVMAEDPNFRWQRTTYFGASLAALAWLGRQKGYDLVGTDSHGVNAFFVRSDCAVDKFPDPAALYHFSPFAYGSHPHRDGPSVEG